jgi:hypothetical protein
MLTATVQLQQMMATEFGAAQGCEAYGRWCSIVWCKVTVVSKDHAFIFMVYKFRKTAWSWRQRHQSLLKPHEPLCQCHSITFQKTPIHSSITIQSFNLALYDARLILQTKTKKKKKTVPNTAATILPYWRNCLVTPWILYIFTDHKIIYCTKK